MKINISRIENEELSEQIYQACIDAGFDDCGIISIDDMDGYIANIQKRFLLNILLCTYIQGVCNYQTNYRYYI